MGRNNTEAMRNIRNLYGMYGLSELPIVQKSKLLLSIYRNVCWSVSSRADCVREELSYHCGGELDSALIYLEAFAPDEKRDAFMNRVSVLFESKWMIDLIDGAALRTRDFPYNGKLYFEILSLCYLNRSKYREAEILEQLSMERSSYYDRKKEAVRVFGLSMWGCEIPRLKVYLEKGEFDNSSMLWQKEDYAAAR